MSPLSFVVDSLVAVISPERALRRAHARAVLANVRKYGGAKYSTHTWNGVRASSGTADVELKHDGKTLRDRSRQLYRDNDTVRAIVDADVALVVGSGIDIEPNTDDPDADEKLHNAWLDFCECASADGRMSLWELQRQAKRSVNLGGAVLWHIVAIDDLDRVIPFAIHPIERDQLADDPVESLDKGNSFRNGVEVDGFNRPKWYHIVDHPGDGPTAGSVVQIGINGSTLKANPTEIANGGDLPTPSENRKGHRIPAADIIHPFEALRPGQNDGEPMLAPILNTLQNEADLVDAELTSAKIGACFAAFIQSEASADFLTEGTGNDKQDGSGNKWGKVEPGMIGNLGRGETIQTVSNTRPSQQIAPFRSMLQGGMAAAMKLRKCDLDKDYSQANYTSMRAALLDVMRQIGPVQHWFGKFVAGDVYKRLFRPLAVAAGVNLPRTAKAMRLFSRYTLHPDSFPYVDPDKDIEASIKAIVTGHSTFKEQVAARGGNWRKVRDDLKEELKDPLLKRIFDAALNVQFGDLPETAEQLKGDAPATTPKATKKSKKPKHAE